jgi:catechol-2,3-dioxygenase
MSKDLIRVGTTYIPVKDVEKACSWYVEKLDAVESYQDENKAIINFANQSFFLVKSQRDQTSNFVDNYGNLHFSLTFEVDGLNKLVVLQQAFLDRGIQVSAIEDRGHAGKNFTFQDCDGNIFDVWSELSKTFKEKYAIS